MAPGLTCRGSELGGMAGIDGRREPVPSHEAPEQLKPAYALRATEGWAYGRREPRGGT
jgi:hypothetical protein